MQHPASYWIRHLHMQSHVEGGHFAEVYRSPITLPASGLPGGFSGERSISTSIYFLLEQGQFSAFHRIRSDEGWHFYAGQPLEVFELEADGKLIIHRLGPDPENGCQFQCVVQAGNWFASAPAAGSSYSLCGCTVSPGFDYADFELADRTTLLRQFPRHAPLIQALTR